MNSCVAEPIDQPSLRDRRFSGTAVGPNLHTSGDLARWNHAAPGIDSWIGEPRDQHCRTSAVCPPLVQASQCVVPQRSSRAVCRVCAGDMLPGQVTGGGSSRQTSLLARPQAPLVAGAPARSGQIRHGSRRLVWINVASRLPARMAFRRDQSSLAFRRLKFDRWSPRPTTESLLSSGATWRNALPRPTGGHCTRDRPSAPGRRTSLVRLTTGKGMRLTASLARFHTWTGSQQLRAEHVHFVQPAWASACCAWDANSAAIRRAALRWKFRLAISRHARTNFPDCCAHWTA